MANGNYVFNASQYLDGEASDPARLAWMRGFPPAEAKHIRFRDDAFLAFPQNRWSLSHLRELMPTVQVWRGDGAISDLGPAPAPQPLEALTFESLEGERLTWADSLTRTYTDGIVVLHRGRRVYERYCGALAAHRPHACFSITKSYAATLAAAMVHEGVLHEQAPVTHYLPELRDSAYGDATLRQVLDMQVGVHYSEDYANPDAEFWLYGRAGGFRPRPADYSGPESLYDFLVSLRKQGKHGATFDYKTPNTEVLCWLMTRVAGQPLAELLGERLFAPLGCEQDGYLAIDSSGIAMGGAGLSACLRDIARFGELMRCDGSWHDRQLLPAAVIAAIRRGGDAAKFAQAGYALLPGYSYRDMWWIAPAADGVFEARGIHGQRLYIAPRSEIVIARFASHPIATSTANDPITLPAFAAVCRQYRPM